MQILLVDPEFPIPTKSKNHKDFLPIPLLKIACYHKSIGNQAVIVRGNLTKEELRKKMKFRRPDWIGVTSLFTYWSEYVRNSVQHYKKLFPNVPIKVGGVYATLMPKHCKEYTGCDEVVKSMILEVEKYTINNKLDYSLLENPHPLDYQIVHASRGCFRECDFCGVWRIEQTITNKTDISKEICKPRVVLYDNQIFANPNLKQLLENLAKLRYNGKLIRCESQSGFDARLLTQEYANLIKKARFDNVRVAWDWGVEMAPTIKKAIDHLVDAGYKVKDTYVFMLYNWLIDFQILEQKRIQCWKWQVQITDCRFRPLDQTFDHYNPRGKHQTNLDYYIHPKWTDAQIRQFRKNVRRQNICIRLGVPFYSATLEQKRVNKNFYKKLRKMPISKIKKLLPDAWFPNKITYPELDLDQLQEIEDNRPQASCNEHPEKINDKWVSA